MKEQNNTKKKKIQPGLNQLFASTSELRGKILVRIWKKIIYYNIKFGIADDTEKD